jgi:hypothetical protein
VRRWMARAAGAGAVALTLTGCADFPAMPMPYAYAPPRMGYARSVARQPYVFQRRYYVPALMPSGFVATPMPPYRQQAPEPYTPPPAARVAPAADELRPVDPPGQASDDCVGWWRICHFL